MLLPKYALGQMVMVDDSLNAPVEWQNRIQRGCNDGCGWSGDPMLIVRRVPPKFEGKWGRGWVVIHAEPGQKAVIILPAVDRMDHRTIVALQDARRNWEDKKHMLAALEAHDAKEEKAKDAKAVELYSGMAQTIGHQLRKEGKL